MNFTEKLDLAIASNNSLLIVGLDPNPEMIPANYLHGEDSLLEDIEAWLLWVIESTSDRVCAYKPTLGFYQALGIPGLQLLDKIIAAIPQSIPTILDAKHSDLNTSTVFAKTIFEQWQVDAVTLTPFAGQDHAAPFLVYADKAVFILVHTSNPKAETLQRYPNLEQPYYLQVVKESQSWATPEQLYLEVGTTNLDVLSKIRAIAPERTILLRSLWSKKNNLESLIAIGLNNTGSGLLIPIPQDFLANKNLAAEVANLNQKLNTYRQQKISQAGSCEIWTPDVCLLKSHPYQSLILELYDIGCLLFGEYVQA
ncbi:MAG: orotidine-5'-phosphate decarboxylase, partial [Cyanobacteria bacterium J06631_2]